MVPANPKIYHIVHVDRLPSIIADQCLWCDSEIARRTPLGTTIGMSKIKQRRLYDLHLTSYPDLHVGDCVPFYFCPRSIMLFIINQANHPDLQYRGGQNPIIHLEADLHASVTWAKYDNHRWAFTLSNAGAKFFEDRSDLLQLNEINWEAIQTNQWGGNGIHPSVSEGKQAEFLMEYCFPWHLVERIGVYSQPIYQQVVSAFSLNGYKPKVQIIRAWYY